MTQMIFHLIILVAIYGILAISLNIIVGYTGLFSLGHAAFFGIGAYTSAILSLAGVSFWAAMFAGGIISVLVGLLVGFSTVNLQGDYFCIATLACGQVMNAVFTNWMSLTRGPDGLPGIPSPRIFGYTLSSLPSFALLTLIILGIVLFLTQRLSWSPFGRLMLGIREDTIAAESIGKNVSNVKIQVILAGAFLAGIAGSLFASYISYINPGDFDINLSILILLMVVLGGMGNNYGSLVGAFAMVLIPTVLLLAGLPSAFSGALQELIYGLALIALMLFRPRGLLGESHFISRSDRVEERETRAASD